MERKRTRRGKAIESNVARGKDLTERERKQTQSQKKYSIASRAELTAGDATPSLHHGDQEASCARRKYNNWMSTPTSVCGTFAHVHFA